MKSNTSRHTCYVHSLLPANTSAFWPCIVSAEKAFGRGYSGSARDRLACQHPRSQSVERSKCGPHAHPWLSPEWLFEAVTTAAAKALGVERDYGSLLPGSRAAINVCDCLTETKTVDMVDELTTRINPFQPLIAILGKSSASRRDAAT